MNEIVFTLTLILLSPIFTLPTLANPPESLQAASEQYEYKYADSAGNVYVVNRQSIDYHPITRAESSSGNYDGGIPRKVKIDARQYQEIAAKLDRALNLKSIGVGNDNLGRAKGTGIIFKPDKNRKIQSRVMVWKSQERSEIEALLDRLISGKNSSILKKS